MRINISLPIILGPPVCRVVLCSNAQHLSINNSFPHTCESGSFIARWYAALTKKRTRRCAPLVKAVAVSLIVGTSSGETQQPAQRYFLTYLSGSFSNFALQFAEQK